MVYAEIISGLWIGNIDMMYNSKFIKENDITIIVNCTLNVPFSNKISTKNIRIPLSDSLIHNIDTLRTNKTKILHYIDSILETDNILICCYDGKTISPFIVSLYLIEYGGISKDKIKSMILSKHTEISMDYDITLFDL